MEEQEALRITGEVLTDHTIASVALSYKDLWFLITAVQLLVRHPGVSQAQKDMQKDIAFSLQAVIAKKHPLADDVLEMGWNVDNDVDWEDDDEGYYQGDWDDEDDGYLYYGPDIADDE